MKPIVYWSKCIGDFELAGVINTVNVLVGGWCEDADVRISCGPSKKNAITRRTGILHLSQDTMLSLST